MLKHIVAVKHNRPLGKVVVEYIITDGERMAIAQAHIDDLVPYFKIERIRTGSVEIHILDQGFFAYVCEKLKRQAQDHFHREVVTEIRMNER